MRAAQEFNGKMEDRLKAWFEARGLHDGTLYRHLIGWDGHAITIPIFDAEGKFLCFKFRRSPFVEEGAKYWYGEGGGVHLYNVEQLARNPDIVLCEGEFDCLILEEHGIPAVTSTGGAGSFKAEWASLFEAKNVFICFDNDKAGLEGSMRAAKILHDAGVKARLAPLPVDVGEHGDITDFFIKLGRTTEDFRIVLKHAWMPDFPKAPKDVPKRRLGEGNRGKLKAADIEEARAVPIRDLIGVPVSNVGFACCPFHGEKTPSFRIFPDNHFHCFGCGKHGDAIDFLMLKHEGMMFVDAVKHLTNKS